MTDNEIIKALECCSKSSKLGDCIDNKCTLLGEYGCSGWMDNKLLKSALDLIRRQNAEYQKLQSVLDEILVNERCNYENKIAELVTQKEWYKRQYNEICDNASLTGYESIVKTARAEAITEFEQKVFDLFPANKNYTTISRFTIKQIAKEMKEGVNNA